MNIKACFGRGKEDDETDLPGTASRNSAGVLCISCTGCERSPDVCEPYCIRCISCAVASEGAGDRIRMTAGKDTEVTGPAAELVCRLSALMTMPVTDPRDPRCTDCTSRPTVVMSSIWDTFPEPAFATARSSVRVAPTDDPECVACMQRTMVMVDSSEKAMDEIRATASAIAGRGRP